MHMYEKQMPMMQVSAVRFSWQHALSQNWAHQSGSLREGNSESTGYDTGSLRQTNCFLVS